MTKRDDQQRLEEALRREIEELELQLTFLKAGVPFPKEEPSGK